MQNFSVRHALSFSTSSLVIAHHNEIREEITQIAKKAFSPNCVCWEPLVHLGRSRYEEKVNHGERVPETRRNVPVRVIWKNQKETAFEVRFVDAEAETCKQVRIDKLLEGGEKINKEKHGQDCYDQHRHFSLFVLLVDGMIDKEALIVLATSIWLMFGKLDGPILNVTGWVIGRIAVVVARSYYRILHRAQA